MAYGRSYALFGFQGAVPRTWNKDSVSGANMSRQAQFKMVTTYSWQVLQSYREPQNCTNCFKPLQDKRFNYEFRL